jgi:hypothetical protein
MASILFSDYVFPAFASGNKGLSNDQIVLFVAFSFKEIEVWDFQSPSSLWSVQTKFPLMGMSS